LHLIGLDHEESSIGSKGRVSSADGDAVMDSF
jgi:hypothetical protein